MHFIFVHNKVSWEEKFIWGYNKSFTKNVIKWKSFKWCFPSNNLEAFPVKGLKKTFLIQEHIYILLELNIHSVEKNIKIYSDT